MKKTYIAPLTKVVKIKVETMLAGSDPAAPAMVGKSATSAALDKEDDYDFSDELW